LKAARERCQKELEVRNEVTGRGRKVVAISSQHTVTLAMRSHQLHELTLGETTLRPRWRSFNGRAR
jgi:hypothetical protein